MFSISQLSQRTGVTPQTIRYYERIALLPQARRAKNSYRVYDDADIEQLQFITRARQLDFSLGEIAEILALRERNEAPCAVVLAVMAQQMDEIERRIASLSRLREELAQLYHVGLTLPEDDEMQNCVCRLIQSSSLTKEIDNGE